jgi:hypothetical protein
MVGEVQKVVSHRWSCYPQLPFLISFYIVQVNVKPIHSHLLHAPLLPIQEHPHQPKSVTFRHQHRLLTLVHLERQSIGKIQAISDQTQLTALFIKLKNPAKRIVQQHVDDVNL